MHFVPKNIIFLLLPFLVCFMMAFLQIIFTLFKKPIQVEICKKIYSVSFLTYWFGFLIVWSYTVIQMHSYFALLFTIPFWLAGIYIIKSTFFKRNE